MVVNQQHIKQAWDTSLVSTRDDWNVWMQHLCVEFMRESPSHALRACISLIDVRAPLAKKPFNAAFLSCWANLRPGPGAFDSRGLVYRANCPTGTFSEVDQQGAHLPLRILSRCSVRYYTPCFQHLD